MSESQTVDNSSGNKCGEEQKSSDTVPGKDAWKRDSVVSDGVSCKSAKSKDEQKLEGAEGNANNESCLTSNEIDDAEKKCDSPQTKNEIEERIEKYVYTDYSDEPPSSIIENNHLAWEDGRKNNRANSKEPNFTMKLHSILSRPEFSDLICWMPHGRSWRVLKPKAFEERVIPLYFRHCQYSSFARQVNGWGFQRITQGTDYNSYYHELFLKGRPHLCERMRRPHVSRKNMIVSVDDEPNFYAMKEVLPLNQITNNEGCDNMKLTSNSHSSNINTANAGLSFGSITQKNGSTVIEIPAGAPSALLNLPNGSIQRIIKAGNNTITIDGPAALTIGSSPGLQALQALQVAQQSAASYLNPPSPSMVPSFLNSVNPLGTNALASNGKPYGMRNDMKEIASSDVLGNVSMNGSQFGNGTNYGDLFGNNISRQRYLGQNGFLNGLQQQKLMSLAAQQRATHPAFSFPGSNVPQQTFEKYNDDVDVENVTYPRMDR